MSSTQEILIFSLLALSKNPNLLHFNGKATLNNSDLYLLSKRKNEAQCTDYYFGATVCSLLCIEASKQIPHQVIKK